MIKITLILISLFGFTGFKLPAQDLDKLLGGITADTIPDYAYGTFKGITIINGQSVEVAGHNDLHFLVSHRLEPLIQVFIIYSVLIREPPG